MSKVIMTQQWNYALRWS